MIPRWSAAAFLLLAASAPAEAAVDLFQRDSVWTFHLVVTPEEWDAMQPAGGRFPFFLPNPNEPKKNPAKDEKRDTRTSAFGMKFPYGKANLEFEGNVWKNVGIRFKGNSTYISSSRGLKRPFKIDFDRHVPGQVFQGHGTLNLANDVIDQTHLRQALAFKLFADYGIPSPRTSFVRLHLTVPGKHEKKYIGLYTLIEEIDGDFLKRHFESSKGLLLKPEGIRGLPHLGENWNAYVDRYRPKTEAKKKHSETLIALTKLIEKADDATFRRDIGKLLDVDQFLRFLAVNVMLSNLDSFIGTGHNYYLYIDAKSGKANFLPWDVDLSFGGFFMAGSAAEQAELSIDKPATGRIRLLDRLLAIPEHKAAYREHVRKLAAGPFEAKKMQADIAALEKTIAAAVKDEPKPEAGVGPPKFGGLGRGLSLNHYVTRRNESVAAQLAGKTEGFVPSTRSFFGPPGGFAPGAALVKPILDAADADKDRKLTADEAVAGMKKLFDALDVEKKGAIDEKTLTTGLEKLLLPAPAQGAPPAEGRPASPATWIAAPLFKRVDHDRDGKATRQEFLDLVKVLFKEHDADKDGKINEKELTDALSKLMPRFGQAAGPGGRP